ncbi:hydroxymethylglutaryl-CoA reductase (NADPH) [Synchytrium microbalum]|uniref:3-hydroxy-3-methylglutaryl coenzyme A reductase n=1 Tax=Synchytrium microbalum TaxID=1806994 RepID=A0A507BY04_9FUNG|nr:hydroxymethylglutaryl-CoA reductase (NADPH) [Synchytrium microbalum]TPX31739.1 hydroxymethylglutaryl-CoA reductase (NADPH) [Synchytrium microbalum]
MASKQAFTSHSIWSGFYKKAIKERQAQLKLVFPDLFTPALANNGVPLSQSPSHNGSTVFQHDQQPQTDANGSGVAMNRSLGSQGLSDGAAEEAFPIRGLDEQIADNMIENCVGTLGLPVGLALNFTINSNPIIIPMCMEEPSVVAAASGAAKTVSCFGGFTAVTTERNIIIAQVQLLDVKNVAQAAEILRSKRESILEVANQFCESMAKRGGGVKDVTVRMVPRFGQDSSTAMASRYWLVVHLHIDVCDAMGANCASTVAEGTAPFLVGLTGGRVGLRIVSNLCVERLAKASFKIPVSGMAYKALTGSDVCTRIIDAYQWALDDPFRATTHNKGIMNGIDAVALATGQDWRAIEAAAHAWAAGAADEALLKDMSVPNHYKPLTKYWVDADFFYGELELPVSVGIRGGVLKTNPVYTYTLGMMGNPSAKELAMCMVSVGLAQNLAALRALSTEGIQRGHMSLHAKNIAVASGAPPHAISECVEYMIESNRISLAAAREYLMAHELHDTVERIKNASTESKPTRMKNLSIFYFEEAVTPDGKEKLPGVEDHVTLNIAFQTVGKKPISMELVPDQPSPNPLMIALFGEKTHAWLTWVFALLDSVRLSVSGPERANVLLSRKLKVLSVLLNLVVRRLMVSFPKETRRFVDRIFADVRRRKSQGSPTRRHPRPPSVQVYVQSTKDEMRPDQTEANTSPSTLPASIVTDAPTTGGTKPLGGLDWDLSKSPAFQRDVLAGLDLEDAPELLQVGLPLMLALWQVFEIRVVQWVGHRDLVRELLDEQRRVISNLVAAPLGAGWLSSGINEGLPWMNSSAFNADTDNSNSLAAPSSLTVSREKFRELMTIHGKRFQVTLLLLCDAVSLGPRATTAPVLHFLRKLGGYLEWEQARSHDISPSRLERDVLALKTPETAMTTPAANGFIAWLEIIQGWTVDTIYECAVGTGETPLDCLSPFGAMAQSADNSEAQSPTTALSVPYTPDASNASEELPLPGHVSAVLLLSMAPASQRRHSHGNRQRLPQLYRRLAQQITEFIKYTDRQKQKRELLDAADALGAGFEPSRVLKGAQLYRRYYEVATLFGATDLDRINEVVDDDDDDEKEPPSSSSSGSQIFEFAGEEL